MHEFCPSCAQNGIRSKIKAYQLNCQDAVYMCSAQKCTWPVGIQQVVFFKRPIGKDWTRNWDESESKYTKNEHDITHEFSSYTPPQTPGSEGKDNANTYTTFSTTVPENFTLNEEHVNKFNESATTLIMPYDVSVSNINDSVSLIEKSSILDSNNIKHVSKSDLLQNSGSSIMKFDDSNFELLNTEVTDFRDNSDIFVTNNNLNLEPKQIVSESVNYNIEELITKDCTPIKNNENNMLSNNCEKMPNVKNCKSTSISNNSVFIKTKSISDRLSTIKYNGKVRQNQGLKILKSKRISIPYKKFDFNDIMIKAKSTNLKNDNKLNIKHECKNGAKSEKYFEDLSHKENECASDLFDFNEIFNSNGINMKNECSKANEKNVNGLSTANFVNNSQLDFDSILGLTSCSKDSGVDQDLTDNGDLDFHLDDLLADISHGTDNLSKCEVENIDDYKWVDSLFE